MSVISLTTRGRACKMNSLQQLDLAGYRRDDLGGRCQNGKCSTHKLGPEESEHVTAMPVKKIVCRCEVRKYEAITRADAGSLLRCSLRDLNHLLIGVGERRVFVGRLCLLMIPVLI